MCWLSPAHSNPSVTKYYCILQHAEFRSMRYDGSVVDCALPGVVLFSGGRLERVT